MIPSSLNAADLKNVREKYCFYLDLKDRGLSKTLSNRIQDLGLREEVFLTECVTHVVRVGGGGGGGGGAGAPPCAPSAGRRTRADAMLQRLHPACVPSRLTPHRYDTLSVREAILLLDQIYDKYFKIASRKSSQFIVFNKDFIKVEILDRLCRPFYEEFDKWPELTVEPLRLKKPTNNNSNSEHKKMTRRNRPRVKEREKNPKPGYCEICTVDYLDIAEHQQSPHHLAFIQNHNNFLALDELIKDGGDMASFLEKSTSPLNGERRSQRKMCNGDHKSPKKRSTDSKTSVSPETNGRSPRSKGHEDERRRHSRRKKKSDQKEKDQEYYKVVSKVQSTTKLRSSGSCTKKQDHVPAGEEPLVIKIKKIRNTEVSVLSNEAEQFVFSKRWGSTSSVSSDEGKKKVVGKLQPLNLERRRQARPMALKEESSEEDTWPEKRRRKRRVSASTRRSRPSTRSAPIKLALLEPEPVVEEPPEPVVEEPPKPIPKPDVINLISEEDDANPLRNDVPEKCLKWEDGRLKYAPAVEQLEFAFESVPKSEPWYATFKRQDNDRIVTRNVPKAFSAYTESPKLPYEIGHLPPLKPHYCILTQIPIPEERPPAARSYGTRRMKKLKPGKKRLVSTFLANETHPRKSPREHASTLAMLGAAGIRRLDDNKSTASEDNANDLPLSEIQQSEKMSNFLSTVFDDAADFEMQVDMIEPDMPVVASSAQPDVLQLVEACDRTDLIREQLQLNAAEELAELQRQYQITEAKKPAKTRKKNRTGWPKKRRNAKKKNPKTMIDVSKIKKEVDSAAEEDAANADLEMSSPAAFSSPAEFERDNESSYRVNVQLLLRKGRSSMQPVVRMDRVDLPLRRSSRSRTQALR